jgi:hypothetical protein
MGIFSFISIVISSLLGYIAYLLFPAGVLSTHFPHLTFGKILRLIGSIIFGMFAIDKLFKD